MTCLSNVDSATKIKMGSRKVIEFCQICNVGLTNELGSKHNLSQDNLADYLQTWLLKPHPQLTHHTLSGYVCSKCRGMVVKLHSLNLELETITGQLLECLEPKLSVNTRMVRWDAHRRWQDCVEPNNYSQVQAGFFVHFLEEQ